MPTRLTMSTIASVLLVGVGVASAQTNSAIAGNVRDPSGAVLPGVTVEASSPALIERVRSVMTDGAGQYKIVELGPGTYSVSFSLPGFATFKREGIELTTGFTAVVNAELKVGEVAETVTVSGQSPVVDTQNVVQLRVMTRDVVDTVPTGKSFANLAILIPGTTVSGLGRANDVGGSAGSENQSIAIHGGRSFDQVVQVDGLSIGQVEANGSVTSTVFPDGSVEEVSLEVGAHSVEMQTGGVKVNIVPKSGGNTFRSTVYGSYSSEHLQSDNLTPDLIARGLPLANRVKYLSDINPSMGGPIIRDRLWFHAGYRDWRTVQYSTLAYDTDPTDWVYQRDNSRKPMPIENLTWNASARFTLQATAKSKLNVNLNYDHRCDCQSFTSATVVPEAASYVIYPSKLVQGTWTAPFTNRLLVEAGASAYLSNLEASPEPGSVGPPATELNGGFQFRSRLGAAYVDGYQTNRWRNYNVRAAVSYVTGTHAFKAGFTYNPASSRFDTHHLSPYAVSLLNGTPNSVSYLASPYYNLVSFHQEGLFARDQWTLKRLTLDGGLRVDIYHSHYPDVHLEPTLLLPARDFTGRDVLNWKDVSPRLGASYDLRGNGKTAVKVSVSRYVAPEAVDLTREVNPAGYSSGNRQTRQWIDANRDFIPDGDPLNPAANGELGPSTNLNFGAPVPTVSHDPALDSGWGVRGFNWETTASVQHEILPRVSVNAAYFRRSYGNFTVINNLAVASSDFSPYCVTAPTDSRLPSGGGQQLCEIYDVNPGKLGQFNNVRTFASNFGEQYERWQGVDLTVNARLTNSFLLQGGLSSGKAVADNCDIVSKRHDLLGAGVPLQYCHREQPRLTDVKLLGSYTMPLRIQLAATFQSQPGIATSTSAPQFGVAANAVFTNAQIAPSLGRNLAAGPNGTVTVNVVQPGEMLLDRLNQLDFRVARVFAPGGRAKIKGIFDLYNLLNANPVLVVNTTYGTTGATWLVPTQILLGRLVKFGVQLDF